MKIDLVNEIGKYGGLWQSSERVDAEVEELISNESNKVVEALHCQIKFHKEVLYCTVEDQKNSFRRLS